MCEETVYEYLKGKWVCIRYRDSWSADQWLQIDPLPEGSATEQQLVVIQDENSKPRYIHRDKHSCYELAQLTAEHLRIMLSSVDESTA